MASGSTALCPRFVSAMWSRYQRRFQRLSLAVAGMSERLLSPLQPYSFKGSPGINLRVSHPVNELKNSQAAFSHFNNGKKRVSKSLLRVVNIALTKACLLSPLHILIKSVRAVNKRPVRLPIVVRRHEKGDAVFVG